MSESLMFQRRPEWLQRDLEKEFMRASQPEVVERYSHHGIYTYEFLGSSATSAGLILDTASKLDRPLRVLDVGTGRGDNVWRALQNGHYAQGVTAHDYREFDDLCTLEDEHYIIGDANNLLDLHGIEGKYDVVMSRWTLRHLFDPLSVVEQMASLTSEGGVLVFDGFSRRRVAYKSLDGVDYSRGDFVADLTTSGFEFGGVSRRLIDDYQISVANGEIEPVNARFHDLVAHRVSSQEVGFLVEYGEPIEVLSRTAVGVSKEK